MFTTPCFIRKNTPELRNKLEELGIHIHPTTTSSFMRDSLYVNRGFYSNIMIGYEEEVINTVSCQENEDLFLAIAALRDDSDKHQWFTDGQIWVKSDVRCFVCNSLKFHRASINELIEHFK